jgi:hypothetical protein
MKLTKLEIFVNSGSKGKGTVEQWYELFYSETKLKDRLRHLKFVKEDLSVDIQGLCYFSLRYCVREISLIHCLWLLPKAKKPKCIQRPENVVICLRLAAIKSGRAMKTGNMWPSLKPQRFQ